VKWYFESKNLSLKNAFSLRSPLSVENQADLRQYYSQYFVELLSATELLLENEYQNREAFQKLLYERLAFSDFSNGVLNYCYLRELRNSIIHRGLDICSASHVNEGFLFVIAPATVTDRKRNNTYNTFGYYLVDIIQHCERSIGQVFLEHFKKFDLFRICISQAEYEEIATNDILNCTVMPAWAKAMALNTVGTVNYQNLQENNVRGLYALLEIDAFKKYFSLPYP
jgi:hypothetical protein